MTTENAIRLFAGTLVLAGLAIAQWVSPWGLLLSAFVGLNLMQASVTHFCPAEIVLRRIGLRSTGQGCGPTSAAS